MSDIGKILSNLQFIELSSAKRSCKSMSGDIL